MLKIENMLNFMILPFFYRVGDQHDHKQKNLLLYSLSHTTLE